MASNKRICLLPRLSGVGGMVSFQHKFAGGLASHGVEVCYDLADLPYQAVLVIGGTRNLAGLWRAKQKGVRIVQRLNGMNWVHRQRKTGLRHYARSEYGNLVLSLIRSRLAEHIVYQSEFAYGWWERVRGATRSEHSVVYNGVDLQAYSADGPGEPPADRYRVLMVEGSMLGGYEIGLEIAIELVQTLGERIKTESSRAVSDLKPVELMVVGRVAAALQETRSDGWHNMPVRWEGVVRRQDIPAIDRSAHLLYSADLNAACPNSVIEALACGLPVLSFDTGALPELVTQGAGKVVPYGADPWRLEKPSIRGLAEAALDILQNQRDYRPAARRRAEEAFGLEKMVDGYLQALGLL